MKLIYIWFYGFLVWIFFNFLAHCAIFRLSFGFINTNSFNVIRLEIKLFICYQKSLCSILEKYSRNTRKILDTRDDIDTTLLFHHALPYHYNYYYSTYYYTIIYFPLQQSTIIVDFCFNFSKVETKKKYDVVLMRFAVQSSLYLLGDEL